jgi:hypothetical protein
LSSVDLPQPDAPSTQTNSPGAADRVMSSSTVRPSYAFVTPRNSTAYGVTTVVNVVMA